MDDNNIKEVGQEELPVEDQIDFRKQADLQRMAELETIIEADCDKCHEGYARCSEHTAAHEELATLEKMYA